MSDTEETLLGVRRGRRHDDEDDALSPGIWLRCKYGLILLVSLFLTMMIRTFLSSMFDRIPFLETGCDASETSTIARAGCASEMLIYRVSFALLVFFVFHWVTVSDLTCCIRSRDRATLQESFFTFKILVLILIFIGTLFLPNKFFAMYAYVCLFCSAAFLLMNVVLLVDFSYQWSDLWGERAERNGKWMWYLLAIAVGSCVIAIGVTVASFIIFVPHSDCNYNAFAITSVLVGALIYTILSIYVPHGSIVPSSIVFLYTSFIMFFTLRTVPDAHCNRLEESITEAAFTKGVGMTFLNIVLLSFTLAYTVVSSGGGNLFGSSSEEEDEDPDESGHLSRFMYFYTVMILGSMYLAMLGTGWHVSGAGEDTLVNSINVAFWVRMTTVWMAMVLYIWSLVAPYTCCKGRDFGFAIDDDWV